jgi:SAM-dependent methyltransferase
LTRTGRDAEQRPRCHIDQKIMMVRSRIIQNDEPEGTLPRLYSEFAEWWPLLSPAEDYAEEATFYALVLQAYSQTPVKTLLELGSGGGNNASHLKQRFSLTLVDPSEQMLEVSQALNPECEHIRGDMRNVRLERQFDAVFIHDAICYMTSEGDLRQAIHTAFLHCRPGGVLLLAPDHIRETFRESTAHGGSNGEHGALRFLEWTYDPDPEDSTYTVEYAYVLRDLEGRVQVEHDRHVEGLFSRDVWTRLIEEGGFEPQTVTFPQSIHGAPLELFVGRRPL